jgi:hypothetical protein
MYLTGPLWPEQAKNDPRRRDLIQVPTGKHVTWDELLAGADPNIAKQINVETFTKKEENIQKGLNELDARFGQTDMDAIVMFGDDQNEWFFYNNYPTIHIYWGDKVKITQRRSNYGAETEASRLAAECYDTGTDSWPVDAELGEYLVEALCEADFDVAHSQYQQEEYGGRIGPSTWYLDHAAETAPREFGLPHAYCLPVGRWFHGKQVPIVPITLNTCYPPNWISPRRAYALGRAVREAVNNWSSDKKVAFGCSGGLSHFVVDEEIDRLTLRGLSEANGEILTSLPRHRLQSATTEILNWVATQGALHDVKMEVLTYEPGYRTLAGTGCGCAVGAWEAPKNGK